MTFLFFFIAHPLVTQAMAAAQALMAGLRAKRLQLLLNDYHLLSFDTLDSTNEERKQAPGARRRRAWRGYLGEEQQTAGKAGRLGRNWVSL